METGEIRRNANKIIYRLGTDRENPVEIGGNKEIRRNANKIVYRLGTERETSGGNREIRRSARKITSLEDCPRAKPINKKLESSNPHTKALGGEQNKGADCLSTLIFAPGDQGTIVYFY